MMRRAFDILSLLSLAMLVVIVALWAADLLGRPWAVPLRWDGVRWGVWSDRGRLVLDNTPQMMLEDEQLRWLEREVRLTRYFRQEAMDRWKQLEWPAAGLPDAERAAAVEEYRRAEEHERRASDAWYAAVVAEAQARGNRRVVTVTRYFVPQPAAVAVAAAFPTTWMMRKLSSRRRRRRRLAQGLCACCGYDLRGNAGPGRCPECGSEYAGPHSVTPTG